MPTPSTAARSLSRLPAPTPVPARERVVRFAAAFLWADLELRASERRFLEALATDLGVVLDPRLLVAPPPAHDVDPRAVDPALADTVRDVVLHAIAADGHVDEAEMRLFDLLDELLPPPLRDG